MLFRSLAMGLVLFGWAMSNSYIKDLTNVDIRAKMFDSQMKQIEDELTPFGIIDNGQESETFVQNGDTWTIINPKEMV